MRLLRLTRAVLCSVVTLPFAGCQEGGADRVDPTSLVGPEDVPPEGELRELVLPQEVVEAYTYGPVDGPVFDLAPSYGFSCEEPSGSRVAQRLNRFEYNNTVRDLLGVEGDFAQAFPKDDFGDSFDNNARALTVSPVLTEAYVDTAEQIAALAFAAGSDSKAALVPCTPQRAGYENCASQVLSPLLTRAFRRPVSAEELERYVGIVVRARDEGATFEDGLRSATEAALLSANFLFRLELDPDPEAEDVHALTQYELASRLSYFMWSSMPDEALFTAARNGELNSADALLAQVDRMLEDPKAEAMLSAFAGQWLEVNDITDVNLPAAEHFPEFTEELQWAMEEETRLLMRDVLRGDLSFDELLTTRETYANALLAEYYGLEGVFPEGEMVKASLEGTDRQGLLTHASILTLTSAPTRTSLVRRGVFVLTNLLCDPPLPPPPDVQGDLAQSEGDAGVPLSDLAREHSANPECAGCHTIIDPIGLGLENFDAIGRHRTEEEGQQINATGELYIDGEFVPFEGPLELSELLSEDERLKQCAVRKLYTFALGRIPNDEGDACRMQWLEQQFEDSGFDFRHLIAMTTLTDSFRARHGGLTVGSSTTQEEN